MLAGLKDFLFGNGKASKSVARSRLHFVLVQDRTGLTPEELSSFKKELVGVIEKYFMIDEKGFDIDYRRESETTTLLINSPVIVRRQDAPGYGAGAKHAGKSAKADAKTGAAAENGAEPEPAEASSAG